MGCTKKKIGITLGTVFGQCDFIEIYVYVLKLICQAIKRWDLYQKNLNRHQLACIPKLRGTLSYMFGNV